MKYTILFAIIALTGFVAHAQIWDTVGARGFSAGEADYECIAIDRTGTPYVAFSDLAHSANATVMKFDGSAWVNVGIPGFTGIDGANFVTLALDKNGKIFVGYADLGDTQKASAMTYDGTDWVYVGNRGFSAGNVAYTSMAIDTFGMPVIAYQDDSFPCCDGSPTSVMRFDGTTWNYLGAPRFTNPGANSVMAIDKNNTPYVAYVDYTLFKTAVMKFNGTTWNPVGFSSWFASSTSESIAFDTSGTPYIAISDNSDSNKASVLKFDGSNWVYVGATGFSPAEADNLSIAIDRNGTPYVVYDDASTSPIKARVMKYDGSSWVFVGGPLSAALVVNPVIAIDSAGTPYVCYQDFHVSQKATVMKYAIPTRVEDQTQEGMISIFPNPAHNELSITSPNAIHTLIVTDMVGRELINWLGNTKLASFDISMLNTGLYFATINGAEVLKWVKD